MRKKSKEKSPHSFELSVQQIPVLNTVELIEEWGFKELGLEHTDRTSFKAYSKY